MKKKFYRYKRFWLLLLIAAYLLMGFFYVPKIIKQQLQQQISNQLNMHAELTAVKFNPLTFSIQLHDLKLTDANQKAWYNSKKTAINFDPFNLLWGEWKFSDLKLFQPNITLLINEAGQILIPALPDFPAPDDTRKSLNFTIEDIEMTQGHMSLQAGNVKQDFALNIKRIEINQDKLSFSDEDTHFDIKITTDNDESIALNGQYNHLQQLIESQIELIDWQATTLNKVLPDQLMINNQSGLIHASGEISWLLSQKPRLNFTEIQIQGLNSVWQDEINVKNLNATISNTLLDTETQIIQIESINSDQANWQLNWPLTLPSDLKIDEAPNETTETSQWQVKLKFIEIINWPVEIIDNTLHAQLRLNLDSLGLNSVNNNSEPFIVTSQISLAPAGLVTINSEQSLAPLNLNADIAVADLTLAQLNPWITAQSGWVLTQGRLKAKQNLVLTDEDLKLNGNLSISNAIILNQAGQGIADIDELVIGATSLSSQDKSIVLDQITMDRANGIIIDAAKNSNIQNLETDKTSNNSDSASPPGDWTIKVGTVNMKDTNAG